ncbi:MAG: CHAD domain-containing protein [Chloroflexota bacterium]|nr:MAG: CHAD domain-containing protein [Chloroflexota bacterium]
MPAARLSAEEWAACVILTAGARALDTIARLETSKEEAVHDARVALRRFRTSTRALASTLQTVVDPAMFDSAIDAARALATALGAVRDRDVEIAWLAESARESPADGDAIGRLIVDRQTDRGRSVAAIDPCAAVTAIASIQSALTETNRPNTCTSLAPLAGRLARRSVRRLRRALDVAIDRATLHRARVAGKRARYALEIIAVAAPDVLDDDIRTLTALQDALGAHNDATTGLLALARDIERIALMPDRSTDATALARLLLRREAQREESLAVARKLWNDVPRPRRLARRLMRELG